MIRTTEIMDIRLAGMDTSMPLPSFASRVPAGFPSPADDFEEGKLDLNTYLITNPPATFFVRVSGDSMVNIGMFPGDVLVVDRSIEAVNGKVIIAVLNGELTVKRLRLESSGKASLWPENPKYPPILLNEEIDFRVWGVVTAVVHKV